MEFSKHIEKGIWGFADKALPAIYGIAFMFIVIRNLPTEQYGALVIFQTIFMLIISLGYSFAVQPMVKYLAEDTNNKAIVSAALAILFIFCCFIIIVVLIFSSAIANFLDSQHAKLLNTLLIFLPILVLITLYRLIASGILQAVLDIKRLFFIDLSYYGLTTLLLILLQIWGVLQDAHVVIYILILTSSLASIISYYLSRHFIVPNLLLKKLECIKILKYGSYGLAGNVGYTVYSQFDNFFASAVGGVNGVAIYNAAKTFTRAFDIFAQVIQMLVMPASSKLYERNDKGNLKILIEKAICFSLIAIIPLFIVYEFCPDFIFKIVYGNRYLESIPILRVLTILALLVPFANVVSSVLYGIGKVSIGFVLSIIMLILSFFLFTLLGNLSGLEGIIYAVVLVQLIVTSIGVIILKHIIPFSIFCVFYRIKDVLGFVKKHFNTIVK